MAENSTNTLPPKQSLGARLSAALSGKTRRILFQRLLTAVVVIATTQSTLFAKVGLPHAPDWIAAGAVALIIVSALCLVVKDRFACPEH